MADTHTIGSCVFVFVLQISVKDYVKLFHKQCEDGACYMCHLAKGGTFFMNNSCCFIGHRKIDNKEELKPLLRQQIAMLLEKGITKFFFGSMSDFDDVSWEVVTELKETYPSIKRIYVRSAYQYIDKLYEDYLLESYEETYYPPKLENAGKCSYVERNYEMIDKSKYCIFYYNENYLPELKRAPKHNMLPPSRRRSGTKIAYEYAIKKKKEIINIYQ